jgi:hypothetical protein
MVTGSSVKVGANMERDYLSQSLVIQQNFNQVPQLEFQDLFKFLDLFPEGKLEYIL